MQVPTVGCRRCGGGLAGATGISNVLDGVDVARRLDPDLLLFDGSGAALPPVAADARVLVVPAHQPPEVAAGYLNAYRILLADLVVLTHCEEGTQFERIRAAVAEVKDVQTIATVQRPRPVAPVAGRRVALFTTAPPAAQEVLGEHLVREHGAETVAVSGNLADRNELRIDLDPVRPQVFVVELKAAAVDVVAEAALERGIPLVLADADVRTLPGEPDLDEALLALVRAPEPSVG